jgi:hypothetical protein
VGSFQVAQASRLCEFTVDSKPARRLFHESDPRPADRAEQPGWLQAARLPFLHQRSTSRRGWSRTSMLVLPKHVDVPSLPHAESIKERPAGIEPALPPWQGSTQPLHHGRLRVINPIVKKREHRAGLEPAYPRYEGGVLAARRPVLVVSRTRGTRTLTSLVKSQVCCR